MSATGGTQSVDRAAALLRLVVEADGPITFTELVDEGGLARSTTSRLLAALEANHLLERDSAGTYRSGALFALHAVRHDPWSQVARLAEPVLRKVGAETGETVNLGVPRGDSVVQIAQVDSSYLLGSRDWRQVSVPAHCSALGKVLYAYGALALPEGELQQLTDHSLNSSAALVLQLSTVRRDGYAVTRSELEIGLDGVAVPVQGPDGTVVAALGVSGPTTRLKDGLGPLGQHLIDYARDLSALLRPGMSMAGIAR